MWDFTTGESDCNEGAIWNPIHTLQFPQTLPPKLKVQAVTFRTAGVMG